MNRLLKGAAIAVFLLTPTLAKAETVKSFRLRNTTTETVSCRIVAGETNYDAAIPSGKRWRANIAASEAVATCTPPVKQLSYRMTGNEKYVLLREETGGEIEIVSVTP